MDEMKVLSPRTSPPLSGQPTTSPTSSPPRPLTRPPTSAAASETIHVASQPGVIQESPAASGQRRAAWGCLSSAGLKMRARVACLALSDVGQGGCFSVADMSKSAGQVCSCEGSRVCRSRAAFLFVVILKGCMVWMVCWDGGDLG